jgi:hypothetical protein
MNMKSLLIALALFAASACAADITGTWKGTADMQGTTIERTFVFKQDGTKLTGETTSERMGKSEIKDGKVEGDSVSFWVTVSFGGNEMKINYTGKVSGNEIKFRVEAAEGGFSIDYVAKKQ